jgi:2-polyprenyl-3-methyl-5-hydroxy-6-metoxy-1,4-benzoquinol methylase
VETLAELAAGQPVVEFGIGTGRIALPLAERGLEVHGIDGSPEMVSELWRKPGATSSG